MAENKNTLSFFQSLQFKINDTLIKLNLKSKPLTQEEIEELNLTPEQRAIRKEADELLKINAYEQYLTLVRYGYEPSLKQKEQLKALFIKSFDLITSTGFNDYTNEDFPYNQLLKYGYKMSYQEAFYVVSNTSFQIYCEDHFKLRKNQVDYFHTQFSSIDECIVSKSLQEVKPSFENLVKEIKILNQTPEFCEFVFNGFYKKIQDLAENKGHVSIEYTLRPLYAIYHTNWLQENSSEKFEKIKIMIEQLNLYAKKNNKETEVMKLIGEMRQQLLKYDNEKFINLVDKTKKAYTNAKADIRIEILREAIPKQAREIPEEALSIIQKIEEKSIQLERHKELLTVEQSFNLKNLIEVKLPDILNQYKSIPEEIRASAKVDNKTAKDLLLSSLENIESIINTINLSLGEVYLQNLNVSEQYTKKLSLGK